MSRFLCSEYGVSRLIATCRYTCETDQGVHGMTAKTGDVFKVTVWALYDIDEQGKMSRIRCNLWEEKMLGQVDKEQRVRESKSRAQEDLR